MAVLGVGNVLQVYQGQRGQVRALIANSVQRRQRGRVASKIVVEHLQRSCDQVVFQTRLQEFLDCDYAVLIKIQFPENPVNLRWPTFVYLFNSWIPKNIFCYAPGRDTFDRPRAGAVAVPSARG